MGKLDRISSAQAHSPVMADSIAKEKFAADVYATAEGANQHQIAVIVARVALLQNLVAEILVPGMRAKESGAVEAWTGVQTELSAIGVELRKLLDVQESNDEVIADRRKLNGH